MKYNYRTDADGNVYLIGDDHVEDRHYRLHCTCGYVARDRSDLDEHIANSGGEQ